MNKQNGFTLLEIIVVVAIIGIVAAMAFMSIAKSQVNNAKKDAVNTVVTVLEGARSKASNGYGIGNWGVHFLGTGLVTFEDTYVAGSGTSSFIPSFITLSSSTSEVIFKRLTGKPVTASAVTITLTPSTGNAVTVSISADGIITSPY